MQVERYYLIDGFKLSEMEFQFIDEMVTLNDYTIKDLMKIHYSFETECLPCQVEKVNEITFNDGGKFTIKEDEFSFDREVINISTESEIFDTLDIEEQISLIEETYSNQLLNK